MKQLLIQVDESLYARLEAVAPGKTRRRSAFIRDALLRALWALEEEKTAEAYRRQPDSAEEAYFDAGLWEDAAPALSPAKAARRTRPQSAPPHALPRRAPARKRA